MSWPALFATYALVSGLALLAYGIANSIGRALRDIREGRARRDQSPNLADGDCAIRGGVKGLVTHNGANSPERG